MHHDQQYSYISSHHCDVVVNDFVVLVHVSGISNEQAVTVIYKLTEHPDVICGEIFKQLSLAVFDISRF